MMLYVHYPFPPAHSSSENLILTLSRRYRFLELDGVTDRLQALDAAGYNAALTQAVKLVGTKVLITASILKHVIDNHQ